HTRSKRDWSSDVCSSDLYLIYRTLDPVIAWVQRSTDGLTYGPATEVGVIGQVGAVDVDQKDGTIYVGGSSGKVCHSGPVKGGNADRKSTRLNSSHVSISYAVFCLKKKKHENR